MNEEPRIAASGATLAFRNHERRTYYHEMPEMEEGLYAVALLDAHFPHQRVEPSSPYVVSCMQYSVWGGGEGWGWNHVDPDTKADIGRDLTEMGALPDQWYYMVLGE